MAIQNVRSHGATGGGSVDDSDAIIAAVNACFGGGGTIKGGEVYLPAGTYIVSKTVVNSLSTNFRGASFTIRGDGPQATRLILDQATTNVPIFNIVGANDSGGNFKRATWFTLKDLTLDGQNNQIPTWINFESASLASIERVQILNTYGTGIKGLELWDSTFRNVMIDNVRDFRQVAGVNTLFPAVELSSPSGDSSNNIKFEGVQFSNNDRAISVDMGQDVHVIFFLGCSFMGKSTNGYTTVRMYESTARPCPAAPIRALAASSGAAFSTPARTTSTPTMPRE